MTFRNLVKKKKVVPGKYDFMVEEDGKQTIFYDLDANEIFYMIKAYFKNGYESVYIRFSSGLEDNSPRKKQRQHGRKRGWVAWQKSKKNIPHGLR